MFFQGITGLLDSELWVQLGESATAHVHLGLEELAGNPVRLGGAAELPRWLVGQADLNMLYAISAPVSSCLAEKQYISSYLSKIWVFVGLGFYWWILCLIVVFFFPRIFRLLHVKYADVLFCNCSYSVHNVTEVTAEFLDEKKINPYCQWFIFLIFKRNFS